MLTPYLRVLKSDLTYTNDVESVDDLGTLLLLNLFKDRLDLPGENGKKAPVK
jgi:hypothetical protein